MGPPGSASVIARPATSGARPRRSHSWSVKSALDDMNAPMSFQHGGGRTAMNTTHILETSGAEIAYDVRAPLPTADGRPPLFMIGQPMDAGGFATLASYFPDRTVVTYDPRGLGRSVRT